MAAHLGDPTVRDAVLCDLVDPDVDTAENLAAGDRHAADTLIPRLFESESCMRPGPGLHDDVATLRSVCALIDNAPVRTLLALLCWWDGNGAEANIHLDAAARLDPTHGLAHLLREVLQRAIAPGWITASRD